MSKILIAKNIMRERPGGSGMKGSRKLAK